MNMKDFEQKTGAEKIAEAQRDLPGEQLSRYNPSDDKDVSQATCTLNNPEEEEQKSRG